MKLSVRSDPGHLLFWQDVIGAETRGFEKQIDKRPGGKKFHPHKKILS